MFGLYTERQVRKLTARLRADYDETLNGQRELAESLKEENRVLRARVLELEGEREQVAEALIRAERERKRVREEGSAVSEAETRELKLLAAKCRSLAKALLEKYPDAEDVAAFDGFVKDLHARLGDEEESGFNMDDVIAPKEPLDLAKLCRDLGLMEEDS